MWCDDTEEPECEGYSCPKWGRCQFSKDAMREDSSVKEEWKKFRKERKTKDVGRHIRNRR